MPKELFKNGLKYRNVMHIQKREVAQGCSSGPCQSPHHPLYGMTFILKAYDGCWSSSCNIYILGNTMEETAKTNKQKPNTSF